MPTADNAKIHDLSDRLTKIIDEWNGIKALHAGPMPTDEQPEPTQFYAAWQAVADKVQSLFLGDFATWAAEVIGLFGLDQFPEDAELPEIPDVPAVGFHPAELPAVVTGTDNTIDAGKRLTFWAAAAVDPALCHRGLAYGDIVGSWLKDMVVTFPSAILGYNWQSVEPLQYPLDWIKSAFEQLCNQAEAVAVPVGQSETAQNIAPAQSPTEKRYVMRKIDDKTIEVLFDSEQGSITGRPAFRLQRLIVQKKVHVFDLAGNLKAAEGRGSITSIEDVSQFNDQGRSVSPLPQPFRVDRESLKECHEKLAELRGKRDIEKDPLVRRELEEQSDQIRRYVDGLFRPESTEIQRAKQRVDKGRTALLRDVEEGMPRFAQHIRSSIHYEPTTSQYVYASTAHIAWHFENF